MFCARAPTRWQSVRFSSAIPGRAADDSGGSPMIGDPSPVRAAWLVSGVLAAYSRSSSRGLIWAASTPWLREQLKVLQFWSLEVCVVWPVPRRCPKEIGRVSAGAAYSADAGLPRCAYRVRRTANQPHLLRRADLPERRTEPHGSQARRCATTAASNTVGSSARTANTTSSPMPIRTC